MRSTMKKFCKVCKIELIDKTFCGDEKTHKGECCECFNAWFRKPIISMHRPTITNFSEDDD